MRFPSQGWPRLAVAVFVWCGLACTRAAADDLALSRATIERCKAATVLVDLGWGGSGSGFLVHASGLFVTDRRVVEGVAAGTSVRVVLHPGEPGQKTVPARVVATDADAGLALLKTDESVGAEPLTLSDNADVTELTQAVLFGYPFGRALAAGGSRYPTVSVDAGRVSAVRRVDGALESLQIDIAANPGNPGGPVVDRDGRVIGVLAAGPGGADLRSAVPAAKLLALLRQPVLSLRTPPIGFRKRGAEHAFEVAVLPPAPAPPDGEITVTFGGPDGPKRAFPAAREAGRYVVRAAPCDPAGAAPAKLRVWAAFHEVNVFADVDDTRFRAGNRDLWLSQVRHVEIGRKDTRVHLVDRDPGSGDFQNVFGPLKNLPTLRGLANDLTLDLASAERLTIGAYDPSLGRMPYEITMAAGGKPVAAWRGELVFAGAPLGLVREEDGDEFAGPGMLPALPQRTQGLEMTTLFDADQDARRGSWRRENGAIATRPDPEAWWNSRPSRRATTG